jgi:HK97 family phage portal protein
MACAGIPWLLYQKNRKLKEIEKHPLIDLLANPNPIMGQAKFIENVIAYLQLSGNSYIERVGPNNGPPKELYTLRPDRMVVVVGNITQPIAGYEYTANGMKTTLSNESILHLKTFHPLDDWYGMSPIEAAARTIDQNNEAKAWSVSLLQNGARPSGALITPGNLSDEQFYRTENQLNSKYAGAKNAGKPMLLEGGLDWKEMSLSPVDMSWLEGQKLSSREIAIAFGVPPELIGDSSNKTYSNYKEARQAFYTETILPLMDWLRDDLNRWLTPLFGDNLYLDYDRDEIEALQEDRQSVWDRSIKAVVSGILTPNEAREALGYDAIPEGDKLKGSSVQPQEEQPEEQEDMSSNDNEPTNDQQKSVEWKAFNLQTNEQKTAYWKSFDQLRSKWEKAVQTQVTKLFEQEAQQVIEAVRGSPDTKSIEDRALNAIDSKAWEQLYKAIYTGIMEDFGERTLRGLKSYTNLQTKQSNWLDAALSFIQSAVGKVTQIIDTTKEQIKEIISKGVVNGDGIDQIADGIQELYKDMTPRRAETIARTETIAASNAGSRYAAISTGLSLKKEWISTRDSRTRVSHKHMDGEIKGIDETYSNGLMFPGDPSTGDASETINCRCAEGYITI